MPKFKLDGDILKPGTVTVEAATLEEAVKKAERGEAEEWEELPGPLGFLFEGHAWDENGKEIV